MKPRTSHSDDTAHSARAVTHPRTWSKTMKMRAITTIAGAVLVAATLGAEEVYSQVAPTKPLLQGLRVDGTQVMILNDDGGLAIVGTLGGNASPYEGTGSLLLWHAPKAAFRAGYVEGNQWSNVNIGAGSVAMGVNTVADGEASVVLGANASSNTVEGAFVFGDRSTEAVVNAIGPSSFTVRAAGGTAFYSNAGLSAGVSLAPGGGAWASISDVNRKHEFVDVDGELVLERIAGMPIREWSYRAQDPSIRHLGPNAQDFHAAFGLGENDVSITTSDISGINMLAIQALQARTADLGELRDELRAARSELAVLRAQADRVGQLESQLAVIQSQLRALAADGGTAAQPATSTSRER